MPNTTVSDRVNMIAVCPDCRLCFRVTRFSLQKTIGILDVAASVTRPIRSPWMPYQRLIRATFSVNLASILVRLPGLLSMCATGGHCVPLLSHALTVAQGTEVPLCDV